MAAIVPVSSGSVAAAQAKVGSCSSHCAEHHPGEPVLSKKEFFAREIDRKYCKSGPRCC
jgi:hypothetical protein